MNINSEVATPEFQRAWNAWILSVDSVDANDHTFFAAGWSAALAQDRASQGALYSLDADPAGIRDRAAAAITGALVLGSRGDQEPPNGHWLEPFWTMARAEAELRASQGAAAGVPEGWRMLRPGEVIERDDQFLQGDSITWEKAPLLVIGMEYRPGVLHPARRLAVAPSAPTQGAEREVGRG